MPTPLMMDTTTSPSPSPPSQKKARTGLSLSSLSPGGTPSSSTMMNNNNQNNSNSMVLMEPTEDRPWLVEITAALPERLQQQAAAVASFPFSSSSAAVPPSFSLGTVRNDDDDDENAPMEEEDRFRPPPDVANLPLSLSSNSRCGCIRLGRWMALVCPSTSTSSSGGGGGYEIHVWYTIPTQSWHDQKFATPTLKLQHPKWNSSGSSSSSGPFLPPLIAFQSTQTQVQQPQHHSAAAAAAQTPSSSRSSATMAAATSVFLYVVHPSDGSLFVWKLHTADLKSLTSPSYKTFVLLPLLEHEPAHSSNNNNEENENEGKRTNDSGTTTTTPAEVVTCLSTATHPLPKYILVGTSAGRIFWIRHHQNVLHVEMVPYHPYGGVGGSKDESLSASSSSFLPNPFRWVFGSSTSSSTTVTTKEEKLWTTDNDNGDHDTTVHQHSPFLVKTLFLGGTSSPNNSYSSSSLANNSTTTTFFVTWTRYGEMMIWKASRGGGGGGASTTTTTVAAAAAAASSSTQFRPVQRIALRQAMQEYSQSSVSFLHVLQAAAREDQIHVLVHVKVVLHPRRRQDESGNNDDEEEEKEQVLHPGSSRPTTNTGGVEERLYWLRFEEQRRRVPSSFLSSPSQQQEEQQQSQSQQPVVMEWGLTSCTWLDRFGSSWLQKNHVQVAGLQIADNGVAYAALIRYQSPSTTTATLELQYEINGEGEDDDDDDDERMTRSRASNNTATRMIPILMAHDVPMKQGAASPSFSPTNTTNAAAAANHHWLHEVDLHDVLDTHVLGVFGDDRTYGCTLVASSGLLVRAECKDATEIAQQRQLLLSSRMMDETSPRMVRLQQQQQQRHHHHQQSGSRRVAVLLNHLRSTFWEAYQHPGDPRVLMLPPSIQNADQADLEQAVVKLALELQKDVAVSTTTATTLSSSSSNVLLSKHLAFLDFLQRAGIYRSFMPLTKWHLLSVGQEIAAYQAIVAASSSLGRMGRFLESLPTFKLARWLEGVQSSVVLQKKGGEEEEEIFTLWLERALSGAMTFRQERSTLTYDISSTAKPPAVDQLQGVPVWTSRYLLQKVLHRQMKHWDDRVETGTNSIVATTEQLEAVASAALRSVADSYLSLPCESTKMTYYKMQSTAIRILRNVNGKDRDAFAWSLCKEHAYFWGLCKIAHEHRNERDCEFRLSPLFKKFAATSVCDVHTGMAFGRFVIKWHIDRNLFGEALHFGNTHCQDELLSMLGSEPKLRPYRWILSIQRGDHDAAANYLLESVERGGWNNQMTQKQAKFNLAMAKLSNQVMLQKSVASRRPMGLERGKVIENFREVAHAQEELLDEADAQKHCYPWSAVSLLDYAMQKVDRLPTEDKEGKAKTCFIALVLCASLDKTTVEQRKHAAANVWYKAIVADWEFLNHILLHEGNTVTEDPRGVAHAVLNQSVFGKLVEECDRIAGLGSEVGIDGMMEKFIVEQLVGNQQLVDRSSMHRLLRTVLSSSTTTTTAAATAASPRS